MLSRQIILVCFLVSCSIALQTTQQIIHTEQGVMVIDSYSTDNVHHVSKREINTHNVAGFTTAEKKAIVDKHNELRAQEGSSDMKRMVWNNDLEKLAQNYSTRCYFEHSSQDYRKNVGGFGYIGENLYAGTVSFQAQGPVQLFWDENKYYNYDTLKCVPGEMCGHYTQVVWADSYAVGCGVVWCPVLKGATFNQGYNYVCHYGPGGNYVGSKPYKKDRACSQCSEDLKYCVDKLCAIRPKIGSSGKSVNQWSSLKIYILSLVCIYVLIQLY